MTSGTLQEGRSGGAFVARAAGATGMHSRVHRVYRPRSRFELRVREFPHYVGLIPPLGWTVVMRRARGTWLGWLWIPLRPALNVLTKGLVFGAMLHVGSGDRPYLIFVMVGQGAWDFFDRTVYWAFRSIQTHRKALDQLQIPWSVPIASTVLPAAVDAGQYVVIGGFTALYYKLTKGSFYIDLNLGTSETLMGVLLLAAWSVAIALIAAPLIIRVRDFRIMIRYLLGFWIYLVPVIYPISYLPSKYRGLANWDPITAPVEMIKDGLLATGRPSMTALMVSLLGLAIVLPIGLLFTSHSERIAHARL